jgi:ubiquinone biosynthesis protein
LFTVAITLTSIPQIYRNLNRTVEILSVLSKYGLANWIARLDLEFAKELFKTPNGEVLARHTPETRVRLALGELGPTFVKLGQALSTRADLIGVALAEELQKLQDSLPADRPEQVRATIESELGQSLEQAFAEFECAPLASASIGQVHGARLPSGQRVVVKVRHAGIEDKVRVDLDILTGLAQLAERLPEFKNYRPQATVAEFQRTLLRELDFLREARSMQQFAQDFAGDPYVKVPRAYPELSTRQVLTMERLDGVKFSETERLKQSGADLDLICRRGAGLYLEMIFSLGYYHADPHPGNIMVLPGNVIGLLDFGMVGRIDEQLREDIEEMLLAIAARDAVHLTYVLTRVGAVPPDLDQAGLSLDVSDFISHYSNLRLDELELSELFNDMIEIIRRYQIMLPARMAMLIKMLVILEGTSRLASPSFSLTEVLVPYQRKMVMRRLSPTRQVKKLRRLYSELERLAAVLPRGVMDILQQVQTGRFDIHLDHRGLEPSVNRLALALITSALFLGSSLMLSQKVPPLVNIYLVARDVSILGLLGCVVSVGLGLRLLRAINKSGHLDRRN